MTSAEFPAIYRSSDALAADYQRVFFRAICWHIVLAVLAAVLSAIGQPSEFVIAAQVVLVVGILVASIYLLAVRPDRHWYSARAVAESIKTATWRFVARCEPFDGQIDDDRRRFATTLKAIVEQNLDIAKRLHSHLIAPQITESMLSRRAMRIIERRDSYIRERVQEQLKWYAKQAAHNKERATHFFVSLVVLDVLALCFVVARLRFLDASFWPTDVFLSGAGGVLAWVQARRYSELSGAYALAAHEISILKEGIVRVTTDAELSAFVDDAENAFSREHTQWVARRSE